MEIALHQAAHPAADHGPRRPPGAPAAARSGEKIGGGLQHEAGSALQHHLRPVAFRPVTDTVTEHYQQMIDDGQARQPLGSRLRKPRRVGTS